MTDNRLRTKIAILVAFMLFSVSVTHAGPPAPEGWLTTVQHRGGQDDIVMRDPAGHSYVLTAPTGDDRDPAWSSDGRRLAYASRRQRNWDVYVLDMTTGKNRRITNNPHYDAHPTWSPDGRYLAFESSREKDLDIFVADLQTGQLRDLTEKSSAHDYAPAWSPDGEWIAFTSWRDRNREVYVMRPDGTILINLTRNPAQDERPVWSPDGRWLAFVSDREGERAVYVMPFPLHKDEEPRRISWSGYDESPAWSPDGQWLWFVSPRTGRRPLYAVNLRDPQATPQRMTPPDADYRALANSPQAIAGTDLLTLPTRATPQPLFHENAERQTGDGPPYRLVELADVDTNSARLSTRVDDSFRALRARVKDEVGYDFLARLSDAYRPLDFDSDGSDYLSWHKAGRAIDTLVDLDRRSGHPMMEVVRDARRTETFWQVYLRCAHQDGSCGEPLTDAPWDLSYKARWEDAPGEGGHPQSATIGYYVNFGRLAEDYGWTAISSYEDETFSWKEDKTAMEYWHFQNMDNMTWYQAMHEVHGDQTIADRFTWQDAVQHDVSPFMRVAKGLPVPAASWRSYRLVMP